MIQTAFIATFKESLHNMILDQLKIGERQAMQSPDDDDDDGDDDDLLETKEILFGAQIMFRW